MSTNQSLQEALERKLQAEEIDYLTTLKKTQGISNLRITLQKGEGGPYNNGKIMGIKKYCSWITQNIIGLNSPNKKIQTNRLEMESEPTVMLHPRTTY